ncbi:MAG: cobalamin biosynthesis protein CbiG [Pseudomonadota bacterium]
MGALFDLHVVVDWSAASAPARGSDSLWMAAHHPDSRVVIANPPTRRDAEEALVTLLREAVAGGQRVLVGFDFPFGYPAGAAAVMAGPGQPGDWRGVWARLADAIEEGARNANNRMAVASALNAEFGSGPGPFWGCHAGAATETLSPTKTPFPYVGWLSETRAVDARVKAVSSCWQLAYNGTVGGQALTGIAMLERLRRLSDLGPHLTVWPFETGLTPPEGPGIVLAEIYPSLVAGAVAAGRRDGEVKDRAQVRLLATAFATLDRQGALAPLFEGPPDALDAETAAQVVREEAWILGAGHEAGVTAAIGFPPRETTPA